GHFVLHGMAPDCRVLLRVQDDRFAPQWLGAIIGPTGQADPVTFHLAPRRSLEIILTAKDTGKPLAGARVVARSLGEQGNLLTSKVEGRTDARGRFQTHPFPGRQVRLTAFSPDGEPYLP